MTYHIELVNIFTVTLPENSQNSPQFKWIAEKVGIFVNWTIEIADGLLFSDGQLWNVYSSQYILWFKGPKSSVLNKCLANQTENHFVIICLCVDLQWRRPYLYLVDLFVCWHSKSHFDCYYTNVISIFEYCYNIWCATSAICYWKLQPLR